MKEACSTLPTGMSANRNFPSISVAAVAADPATLTSAPVSGCPSLSVTVPVTVTLLAFADRLIHEKNKMMNEIRCLINKR